MMFQFDACGATHRFELKPGKFVVLSCGRFKDHEDWAKKYNPKRHFDDKWQQSWANKDPEKPFQAPTHELDGDPRFPVSEWKYPVVDEQRFGPRRNVPACIQCGLWRCYNCDFGFTRDNALRTEIQSCPKCGGNIGYLVAKRHNPNREHHRPLTVPEPLILHRVIVVNRDGKGRHILSLAPGHWRV